MYYYLFVYIYFILFFFTLLFDFAALGSITTVLHSPPSRASTIATSFFSSPWSSPSSIPSITPHLFPSLPCLHIGLIHTDHNPKQTRAYTLYPHHSILPSLPSPPYKTHSHSPFTTKPVLPLWAHCSKWQPSSHHQPVLKPADSIQNPETRTLLHHSSANSCNHHHHPIRALPKS